MHLPGSLQTTFGRAEEIASRTIAHLFLSPKPRTFHDIIVKETLLGFIANYSTPVGNKLEDEHNRHILRKQKGQGEEL